MSIKEIISAELASYSDRVMLDGPEVSIDGKKVQTFTLLLHALTTNAVKYGALSDESREVSISWTITGPSADARFSFRWDERHGPAIKPPVRKGFGTVLLETTFSGPDTKRRLAFEGSGLTYELDIPLAMLTDSSANT